MLSQALMEAEVSAQIGARPYERSNERSAYRNGYRTRSWDTRVGTIELKIPRVTAGSYFPSLLEPRRRAERALHAVVVEAYVKARLQMCGSPPVSPNHMVVVTWSGLQSVKVTRIRRLYWGDTTSAAKWRPS